MEEEARDRMCSSERELVLEEGLEDKEVYVEQIWKKREEASHSRIGSP